MMKMNKVMAIMTIVTLTTAMPAMAGNNKKHNDRKNDKVVVVVKDISNPLVRGGYNAGIKRTSHFAPRPVAPRPDVKVCTFKVSRHATHGNVVAKAERIHGVMDAHYNPRTHEVTVRYDARMTTARHIMHSVA